MFYPFRDDGALGFARTSSCTDHRADGGVYESIDQIYMSNHFMKDSPNSIGEMAYFSVFNDHLTDGSHPEAPYNKLASDHGQIMAHMRLAD